jgi:carboxypeptidase family protein
MYEVSFRRLLAAVLLTLPLFLLPASAFAQEAAISGTVTDQTGGVLPGVVVRAVNEANGNSFEAVTDSTGKYLLTVRIGDYRVAAELAGFATVERRGVPVQVGQQVALNLQMAPAALQESVTVTGEAPLVDTTQSNLGSNIDSRQVSELPVNGRNFMDLTLLAAGSRQNFVAETPAASFQLNVDGQQVTQLIATSFGQPRFSKDTIAEFEVITNRFDARQGRSTGIQVNAITKSGTNTPAGSFAGYFRDDRFNAADFIQKKVLPYSDQQLTTTWGGPIKRDRIHYFLNYEYERSPYTRPYTTPYPAFNINLQGTYTEKKGGGRLDVQFSPKTHFVYRQNLQRSWDPYDARWAGGSVIHPSSPSSVPKTANDITARLTRVINASAVNEVAYSWGRYWWQTNPVVNWPNHPQAAAGFTHGTPRILLRGYTIGQAHTRSPQDLTDGGPSIRDDLSFSFVRGGRHDVKTGGEYIHSDSPIFLCINCGGTLDAQGDAAPGNLEALFPVYNDVSTWNLNALISPAGAAAQRVRFYQLAVGDFHVDSPIRSFATWMQDDWTRGRLTLNLGVRYDYIDGTWAEDLAFDQWVPVRSVDKNNVQPRLGFAYSVNDRTVARGGWGMFSGGAVNSSHAYRVDAQVANIQVNYDGRPDFATNPFNGPIPTYQQAVATAAQRSPFLTLPSINSNLPYTHQANVGIQRQLGAVMSLATDFVYTKNKDVVSIMDVNLAYNPATGANYPFTDLTRKPVRGWGAVNQNVLQPNGPTSYAMQMDFTKRMANRWQLSATYLLQFNYEYQYAPINRDKGCQYAITNPSPGVFTCDAAMTLHPLLVDERFLNGDQRNRATINGIWELPAGFQLSGLYFFADNGKMTPTSGLDVLGLGASTTASLVGTNAGITGSANRLRRDGTLIARNSFDRADLHRVDMRIQKRFRLSGRVTLDGIAEVFNMFNHANYNAFVTNEAAANYRQPQYDSNIAFQPRTAQFGFRTTF